MMDKNGLWVADEYLGKSFLTIVFVASVSFIPLSQNKWPIPAQKPDFINDQIIIMLFSVK